MPLFSFRRKSKNQDKHQRSQSSTENRPAFDADPQAVVYALDTWLCTENWNEKRAVLEREQALLLTETAERILAGLILQAQQSDDLEMEQGMDYLMLHLVLLQQARTRGIPVTWDALEETSQLTEQDQNSTSQQGEDIAFSPEMAVGGLFWTLPDDLRTLLLEWMGLSDRDARRFLEAHPELLDPRTTIVLENLVSFFQTYPKEMAQSIGRPSSSTGSYADFPRTWTYLLRDIHERGDTIEAIRQGYVDVYGGLILDLPPWLEKVDHQLHELFRTARSDEAAEQCMELLRAAIVRARSEASLAPVVLAELNRRLGAIIWEEILREATWMNNKQHMQEEGIACLQEALQVYTYALYPFSYANTQYFLGNMYIERIEGERRVNLEQAITCFREALRVHLRDAFPNQYASRQYRLGNAYSERIEGERRVNLEQAITCFREALRIYTHDTSPKEYAEIQHDLGDAYSKRIEGEHRANLEQAITCYREGLRVYTHDTSPKEYAAIQNNLGAMYSERIEGEHRANLEQAITCFREALRIYTHDTSPKEYAMTENQLGLAYIHRIEGEHRTNVEQAITCFREALRVCTHDTSPKEYAEIQHNLGAAYTHRIEGERGANVEQAITCFHEALRVYTLRAFPEQYATIQYSLGNAYYVGIRIERRAELEQAITCFREALRVYTLGAFPEQYARTQNGLGSVYIERIEGERRVNLEQAITCYHEALRVYTLRAFPEQYAVVQQNLGVAYSERIEGERRANLEQAITCFREALRVYTLRAFPEQYRQTQINCARALAEQHNWTDAHDAYSNALSAEDVLVSLGAGIIGRDVILREGGDAAVCDGFALTCLGRISEAAEVIERGRAQGLAEAMALDTANSLLIHDDERRARYETVQKRFIAAKKTLIDLLLRDMPEDKQRSINLKAAEIYGQAKTDFDAIVAEIRAAQDPADFLEMSLDPSKILQAAERGGSGHALVYLVATPWGGVAVAALSANLNPLISARFAALDLPSLTSDLISDLTLVQQNDDPYHFIDGFAVAQAGNTLDLMRVVWPDTTFRLQAEALHTVCVAMGRASALDAAAQAILATPAWKSLVDTPFAMLSDRDKGMLTSILSGLFLSLELQHCLEVLAKVALRPLVAWLREQGTTSLTLIPCGWLAAFPLAAVPLSDEHTVGEALPTSIAPSARSLLHYGQITAQRAGVYALGDPRPTRQELQWGEAEAHTLAKLAKQLGLPAEARVHEAATRNWLIKALRKGRVVDASCHGRYYFGNPLRSALFLAGGERLTLGDVLSNEADIRGLRLLILSACQTAMLDLADAKDEVHSLAAGMVQAGAQAVLAALWAVDDKATYLLMVRFAQEWLPHLESEPPTAALARAQRWLRTVTNRELQAWRIDDFPAPTMEERYAAGSYTPGHDPWMAEASEPAGASNRQLVSVRGRGYSSEIDEDKPSMDVSRYGTSETELRVRARAYGQQAPNACPYADPIYWAGFQIMGW